MLGTGRFDASAAERPISVGHRAGDGDLPQVLHGAPAAVLVIDLDPRHVVYANAAAAELVGERVRLPVDVDAWSDAAGLTDLGGRPRPRPARRPHRHRGAAAVGHRVPSLRRGEGPGRPAALRHAGHPAPLLVTPASGLVRLDGHRSPMIGVVAPGDGRGEVEISCPPGSLLLLYTDGLTEVAGYDADERTTLVEQTVAAVPRGASAETVVDAVLAACVPEHLGDDVALPAVRVEA